MARPGCNGAALAVLLVFSAHRAAAQDLFEIQVYPYETVEPHNTMVEFHTNYFPSAHAEPPPGEFALHHQAHATLEVTHGFTPHFELAGYLVTAPHVPGDAGEIAGVRIRPRVRFPELRNFPFKVSLSFELGFNARAFEPNTRTLELRPILERSDGRLYLSINPDLSAALKGPDSGKAPEFEPGVKVSWETIPKIALGVEYYGATGPITNFDRATNQRHLLFPTVDLNVSPDWELNFGIGRGLTDASPQWVLKSILGYRFKH
jgi:hypothetical protein